MTLEERKRILVIACTCDRLEWASTMIRRRRRGGMMTHLPAWAHALGPLALPFLPRWMRLAWLVASKFTG